MGSEVHPGHRLRIAVWIDQEHPSAWIKSAIGDLIDTPHAEVVEVRSTTRQRPRSDDVEGLKETLWYRLYTWIDEQRTAVLPDPLEPSDIKSLLRENGIPSLGPGEEREAESPDDLDLVFFLAANGGGQREPCAARIGLCVVRFGSADEPPGPPGFWPVLMNRPTTTTDLVLVKRDGEDERLLRATSRTDRFSVRVNRGRLLWRASSLPAKLVKDFALGQQGPRSRALSSSGEWRTPRLGPLPVLRLLFRWSKSVLSSVFSKNQLFLAYQLLPDSEEESLVPDLEQFETLRPPKGVDWADPFPVRREGRYWIFFEEVPRNSNRGHISAMELGSEGIVSGPLPVLERPYHISYPFLVEEGDQLFMIPETAEREAVELYRCVDFPDEWRLEKVILEDVSVVDPTLIRTDGRWWLFVNRRSPRTELWDEDLCLYEADTLVGPWTEHPGNPVKCDVRASRSAGRIRRNNGALLRPAQDCSWRYGYGIKLLSVEELSATGFTERVIATISPDAISGLRGIHTINQVDRLVVVDGLIRRLRWP